MKLVAHLLALALPLALPADRVVFDPPRGSLSTKTFTGDLRVQLEDLSAAVGGQELDPSMFGDPLFSLSIELLTTVTDDYVAVAEGRPTELVRTFDEIEGRIEVEATAGGESESDASSAWSPLEGETVVFRWDDEVDEYAVAFAGEDGDEDLLEGLEEDMDLRFLLPPHGEVAEGDSWTIDAETLAHVVAPGGDVGLEPEDQEADGDEGIGESLEEALRELFEGDAVATYRGMQDALAVVDLVVEVDSTMDIVELIEDRIDGGGELELASADVLALFDGEGVLRWDTGVNRLHSFELSGGATIEVDIVLENEEMGALEATLELSGTMSFGATAEE